MKLYERNKTMQMIGKQKIGDILEQHPVIREISDILQAHDEQAREDNRTCAYIEPAVDFFTLGIIYGIRKERQRRKRYLI